MTRALLFDKSSAHDVELEDVSERLHKRSVLWIDLDRDDEQDIEKTAAALDIPDESRDRLGAVAKQPDLRDYPSHIHVTVLAPGAEDDELVQVDCLVGELWLVTVHSADVEMIREFRDRVTGAGGLGLLDGLSFLADLLEWVLSGYLAEFEKIEDALEEVDVAVMGVLDRNVTTSIGGLVELRRHSGRLRRVLAAHRRVFAALAHPEFNAVSTKDSAGRFSALLDLLDGALGVASNTRESVLGSFELMIALSSQRTNEIMKILTLTSVLLLPAAVLAGVMGMNFKVSFFEHGQLFWVAIGVMALVALATLAVARLRRWV
jgi:magnesium transporter